ncbi:MAG: hypothetical protein IPM21_13700 [Acidobacteria bacterium]|nr:hypothetical protein [Acidobacteriota bacterium]
MERKLKLFVVFFSAFVIGATAYNFGQLSLFMWEQEAKTTSAPESQTERLEIVTEKALPPDDFVPEFTNLPAFDEKLEIDGVGTKGRLIDVKENRDPEASWPSYSRSELLVKQGETWLGFYSDRSKMRLAETTVKRMPRHGYLGPGDEPYDWLKYDKKGDLVFLLNGISGLKPREVPTLFRKDDPAEGMFLEQGFRRNFSLSGSEYVLRVAAGLQRDGGTVNVLVLESENRSQIVTFNRFYKDDNTLYNSIGELLWVGDMDGDGKLDLYFSDFGFEKGGFGSNLYLSSPAKDGNLVEWVAGFNSAGC